MMKTSAFILISFVLFLLGISGCIDSPGPLGIGLIPQQDYLIADTLMLYPTTERSYFSRHTLGSSLTIAVGKTGSYEANALLWFSGIPDTMNAAVVNSADLTLFPNYIAGDSTGTVSFNVHEITSSWSDGGFLWDSLTILSYNGTPVGSFSGAMADSDSVVVSISPQLISEWLTTVSNGEPIFGFLLKPNPAMPGSVIRGFESFQGTRLPRLRIIATQNSQVDTFTLSSGYDTDVFNSPPVVNPSTSLYVQPTISYSAMVVFDVSSLPRGAVIHEALLELTRDTKYSLYSLRSIDSVMATFIIDSTGRSDLYDANPPISRRIGDVYTMNISGMVQRWVKGFPNQGIRIKAYDDYSGSSGVGMLSPFVLYNSKSDASVRPRLRILYSTIR